MWAPALLLLAILLAACAPAPIPITADNMAVAREAWRVSWEVEGLKAQVLAAVERAAETVIQRLGLYPSEAIKLRRAMGQVWYEMFHDPAFHEDMARVLATTLPADSMRTRHLTPSQQERYLRAFDVYLEETLGPRWGPRIGQVLLKEFGGPPCQPGQLWLRGGCTAEIFPRR